MINSNDIQERQNSEFALKVQYAARMCFNSAEKHRLTRAHREKQLKMSCQALHNAPPNRT